jgi:hypothetical protein
MESMRVWLLAVFCAVAVVASAAQEETCVASAFIPSADRIHGETRVLRRASDACVQTVLHSTSFRRGIKEILTREAELWTENKPGYADSIRYQAELEKVKQIIVDQPRSEEDAVKPHTLVMEFVFEPGKSRIDFSRADVELSTNHFVILNQSVLQSLDVSDEYMSRAMLVMTAAALGPDRHDAIPLLESAGWRDLSTEVDVSAPAPVR